MEELISTTQWMIYKIRERTLGMLSIGGLWAEAKGFCMVHKLFWAHTDAPNIFKVGHKSLSFIIFDY